MPNPSKKITKADVQKAQRIFEKALHLQGELYEFAEWLEIIRRKDLAKKMNDAAFEMDLTWRNADTIAKETK